MIDYAELLREAAREIKRPMSDHGRDLISRLEAAAEEMDSELAELREQEPVAWVMILPDGGIDWGDDCFSDYPELGRIPLYPHPPKPAIPEGYVPPRMSIADCEHYVNYGHRVVYVEGWNACRAATLIAYRKVGE